MWFSRKHVRGELVLTLVVGMSTAAWAQQAATETSGFKFWPFDDAEDQAASETDSDGRPWMLRSPLANVAWPEVSMPSLPSWRGDRASDRPPLRERLAAPFQRLSANTRNAWNSTVDRLRWSSDQPTPRVARRTDRQPFLNRLFGSDEPQYEGPRTVSEWMSQDRVE